MGVKVFKIKNNSIANAYKKKKIVRPLVQLAAGDKVAICYKMSGGGTDKWYLGDVVQVDNQFVAIYFEEDGITEYYPRNKNLVYNLIYSSPRVTANSINNLSTSQTLTFDFCNGRETPLDLPAILKSLESTSLQEVMDDFFSEPLAVRRSTRPKKPKLWN